MNIITLKQHREDNIYKTEIDNPIGLIPDRKYDIELRRCSTCEDFIKRLNKLEWSYFIILTNDISINQGLYVFNKIMKIIIKCDYYPIQVVKSDTYGENCIETIRFNSADVVKNMSLRISSFTKLRCGRGTTKEYKIYTAMRNFDDAVILPPPIDIDITRSYKSIRPLEDIYYPTRKMIVEEGRLVLIKPIDKYIQTNEKSINEFLLTYMLYHYPNQCEQNTKYFTFKEFNGRQNKIGRGRYIDNSYSPHKEEELKRKIFKEMFMLHHKKINVFMVIDMMIEITNLDKYYMLYKVLQDVKKAIEIYNQKILDRIIL